MDELRIEGLRLKHPHSPKLEEDHGGEHHPMQDREGILISPPLITLLLGMGDKALENLARAPCLVQILDRY